MKIKLDPGAMMPTRGHKDDAGLDLYSPIDARVDFGYGVVIDTGVHVQLPPGTAGLLVSKSGLNVNHNITSTGLIDCGYTGSIKVKLYNHGTCDYKIKAGDKISQLLIVPYMHVSLFEVDELDSSDRGDDGFGSTGR